MLSKTSEVDLIRSRLAIVTAALTLCSSSIAVGLLVVPIRAVGRPQLDEGGNLPVMLAGHFYDDGRVNAVAWSLSDPVFRVARQDGLLERIEFPDTKDALAAAQKLRCEYVMTISTWRKGPSVYAKAWLYQNGKEIWLDPKLDVAAITAIEASQKRGDGKDDQEELKARMIQLSGCGLETSHDTMRSLAQTWTELLFSGPLKHLPAKPRVPSALSVSPPDTAPPVEPPKARKVDNSVLMQQVMTLVAKGEKSGAIAMLRDAVDVEPNDLERRRALVNVLMLAGFHQEAAGQARRAAMLLPDVVPMRLLAARAWLAADNTEQAEVDLQEAVARDPSGGETRALVGEVALRRARYADAIGHFNEALKSIDSAELHFKRALAHALAGNSGKAKEGLDKAVKIGFGENEIEVRSIYMSAIALIHGAAENGAEQVKALLPRARRDGAEKGLGEEIEGVRVKFDSLRKFLTDLPTPAGHTESHGERALAITLLVQATSDLERFIQDKDEDAASDAQIALGEAIRKLTAAKLRFQNELSG